MAEERLSKEPNDAKGWLLLARAKSSVGRFADALKAYEKAAALLPNEADVWADYADAAAGLSQGDMKGKPLELINKSLALDPKNPKALLLRGTYEIQSGELAAAEKTFTLAKTVSEPNSGFTQIADNALQDIRSRTSGTDAAAPAGAVAGAATPAAPTNATASNSGAPLATLSLTLSPEARKAAEANTAAAVFLIVRAAGAERGPPLAAKKLTAADLDKPVTLTANDGMIGGAGLKAGVDVTIQARLSLAGQPMAAAGDWQSSRINAKLPVSDVKLAISESVKP
jgi:cytochrome c-type biogenesis protein CcmH